jgi:uncharacterized protein (TIGR02172 family)
LAKINEERPSVLEGTCKTTRLMSSRMTSDIIECDGWKVIKLYSRDVLKEMVEEEIRLTNLAREGGIPAPVIHELIQDGDRWGYSYEKLHGPTLMDLIMEEESELDALARSFALLHQEVHKRTEARMPPFKERLRETIERGAVTKELKERVLNTLSELPDGTWVCHGDFHPGNVIVTEQGSAILDWVDAACGHYLADMARTLVLLRVWLPGKLEEMGAGVAPEDIERFSSVYLEHILMSDRQQEELERWLLPVAVARLSQALPGEESRLLELIEVLL